MSARKRSFCIIVSLFLVALGALLNHLSLSGLELQILGGVTLLLTTYDCLRGEVKFSPFFQPIKAISQNQQEKR